MEVKVDLLGQGYSTMQASMRLHSAEARYYPYDAPHHIALLVQGSNGFLVLHKLSKERRSFPPLLGFQLDMP
jgi:hypothetical protein